MKKGRSDVADSPAKDKAARQARAAARRSWPGRKTTLAEQDDGDDVRAMSPEDRVAMMWRLAVDGWLLSGRTLPTYTRAEMPGRLLRLGESDPEAGDDTDTIHG